MMDKKYIQEQVIDYWIKSGVDFTDGGCDSWGYRRIKRDYYNILKNPELCLLELGYDSISSYLKDGGKNV